MEPIEAVVYHTPQITWSKVGGDIDSNGRVSVSEDGKY